MPAPRKRKRKSKKRAKDVLEHGKVKRKKQKKGPRVTVQNCDEISDAVTFFSYLTFPRAKSSKVLMQICCCQIYPHEVEWWKSRIHRSRAMSRFQSSNLHQSSFLKFPEVCVCTPLQNEHFFEADSRCKRRLRLDIQKKTALGKCSNGKFHRWKFCVSAAATAYFAEHLHRILIHYGRTGWQHGTRPLPKWVKEMIMSLLVHGIPVKNTP